MPLSAAQGVSPSALYCLPWAGASQTAFADWSRRLGPALDVFAADFGTGLSDQAASIPEVAERLYPALAAERRPCALYGHSVGALVAFELARAAACSPGTPLRLLAVGASAPPDWPVQALSPGASDAEMLAFLESLDGLPPELLADRDAARWVLDRTRIELGWAAAYRPVPGSLAIPVAVFAGQQDRLVPFAALEGWQRRTQADCSIDVVPGGHFFPRQAGTLFFEVLADRLAVHLAA